MDSDITGEEATYWWAIPAFREYRSSRKFCTNQTNPWPSDAGLIEEFQSSSLGRQWRDGGGKPFRGRDSGL